MLGRVEEEREGLKGGWPHPHLPFTLSSPPETTKTPGVKGFKFNSHTLSKYKKQLQSN